MCLYTKMIMPIKARKTIVVYKVLKKRTHGYETSCMRAPVKLNGNLIGNRGFFKWMDYTKLTSYPSVMKTVEGIKRVRVVGRGYIHAYTTLETAKSHAESLRNPLLLTCVVECTIKPGTLYFKSFDGTEMCARSLFISENVVFEI